MTDEEGQAVEGAVLEVLDVTHGGIVAATRTGPDGRYLLLLKSGRYHIHVMPPSGGDLCSDGAFVELPGGPPPDFTLRSTDESEQAPDARATSMSRLAANAAVTESAGGPYQISGRVTDQSGTPLPGSTVEVLDPATSEIRAAGATDSEGHYLIEAVLAGTYNIRVVPPTGSGLAPAVTLNVLVQGDVEIDFALVPAGTAVFSGHWLDPLGDPIAGEWVGIAPVGTSNFISQYSGSDGSFAFDVAPGEYDLSLEGYDAHNLPRYLYVYTRNETPLVLDGNTTMDILLPTRHVTVQVQDPAGNPVENVKIHTNTPGNYHLPLGALEAYGYSGYPTWRTPEITDSSGSATLWLFPTEEDRTYTFTAIPPDGSGYASTNLYDVTIASDTTVAVTLQSPVTFSGHWLDPLGDPIAGEWVGIAPVGTSNFISQYSGSDGSFAFDVAPGEYDLSLEGYDAHNLPRYLYVYTRNETPLVLDGNTTMDILLPTRHVTVQVQDPAGNPVENVKIHTNTPGNYHLPLGALEAYGYSGYPTWRNPEITDSSGSATLWLFPTEEDRTYTFTAIPPDGSGYASTNLYDVTIASDTTVAVTLQSPVTFSGHWLDPLGDPIAGEWVGIAPVGTSNFISQYSGSDGSFAFDVAPGEYDLSLEGYDAHNLPRYLYVYTRNETPLVLDGNTTMDILLPTRHVTVQVQDPAGNPVENVKIHTNTPGNYHLPLGALEAYGYSGYPTWRTPAITDSSGSATLWLFPTEEDRTYTLTAIPPEDSPFATFNIHNVTVDRGQDHHHGPGVRAPGAGDDGDDPRGPEPQRRVP